MNWTDFLGACRTFVRTRPIRRWRPAPPRFMPRLKELEERTLLSTLTVTSTADNGPGTLRNTIAAAAPGDTIRFSHAIAGETIYLTSGELAINENLQIVGPTQGMTIDGGSAGRVFAIGSADTVSMANLTIIHGLADQGGGIDNAGTLSLSACTLNANEALGDTAATGLGGAIYSITRRARA